MIIDRIEYAGADAARNISSHLIAAILTGKQEARPSAESKDKEGNVRILKRVKLVQNNEVGDWENKWGREVKKQLPNIKNPLVVHGHNFVCVCV